MIIAQLEKLCEVNKKKISPVLIELGISKSVVAKWRNGAIPNGETLIKLATYFNVSTDYLLGLSEQKQNEVKNEKENEKMLREPNKEILEEGMSLIFKEFTARYGTKDDIDFCEQFAFQFRMSVKKAKHIKSFESYPTREAFNKMTNKLELSEEWKCQKLSRELFECEIFDETEADKFDAINKRLSTIEKMLESKTDVELAKDNAKIGEEGA